MKNEVRNTKMLVWESAEDGPCLLDSSELRVK